MTRARNKPKGAKKVHRKHSENPKTTTIRGRKATTRLLKEFGIEYGVLKKLKQTPSLLTVRTGTPSPDLLLVQTEKRKVPVFIVYNI